MNICDAYTAFIALKVILFLFLFPSMYFLKEKFPLSN